MDIFQLFISAIFVNNIVLAQYLGNCPYLGCSKEKGVALGMGGAVIFVIIVATACTWLMQRYVLEPFGLGYLQTIVFIVVIASLVQFVEMFLKKMVPPLYAALGIFLPLITTNCAVMAWPSWCSARNTTCSPPYCTAGPRPWASPWPSCSWRASASGWIPAVCPRPWPGRPSPSSWPA